MNFYRFAFMAKSNRGLPLRPHELRDADVFVAVSAVLNSMGHTYNDLVINHPVSPGGVDTSMEDMERLGEDDLLVISSRPPISEKPKAPDERPVKVHFPSASRFEQRVLFPALREYLMYCTREEIQVDLNKSEWMEPRYRNREDLTFFLKPNEKKNRFEAAYSIAGRAGNFEPFVADRTTAAYMIHTGPLLMPGGRKGPRVLATFGVSGTVSLVFAHHLWQQTLEPFPNLLRDALSTPSLTMVEISITRDVPPYYTSLDFSNEWRYTLITKRPGAAGSPKPVLDSA